MPWIEGFLPFLDLTAERNILPTFWILASVLFFLVFFILFLWNGYKPCSENLKQIERIFRDTKKDEIEETYEHLKEQFSNKPRFQAMWKRFDDSIVRTPQEDGRIRLYSTLEASYFFNEFTLINPFLNLRLYNAVPGLLTGIGILGTFVGLVVV